MSRFQGSLAMITITMAGVMMSPSYFFSGKFYHHNRSTIVSLSNLSSTWKYPFLAGYLLYYAKTRNNKVIICILEWRSSIKFSYNNRIKYLYNFLFIIWIFNKYINRISPLSIIPYSEKLCTKKGWEKKR